MLPPNSAVGALVTRVAECLHSDRRVEAGQMVGAWLAETTGAAVEVADDAKAVEVLTLLLQWCLDSDEYALAAQLLWGETLFTPKPEFCKRVWRAFDESNFILLMGSASTSKSYSMGVRLMLEWIRDPEFTNIKVLGPSEQHLEDNLFTHLVTLHRSSTIPLPGDIGKLYIGLSARSRKSAITGLVIPLGKKAAGRIQGSKRVARKVPHPKFGKLSRLFVFLDEIAAIPVGVWSDIENLVASSQGDSGLKIIGAFNPTNVHDPVGLRVEPPTGWAAFNPETDMDWTSLRGWRVVRLDAARCENVVQKKIIYPGLQTLEGFEMLIRNSGGTDSGGYWSMARGCFPPSGVPQSVIPPGLLTNIKAEVLWLDRPTPCAGVDLALCGGDVAVMAAGSFGLATGFKYPPSLEHPTGRVVMFKNVQGRGIAKNVVLLEALLKLPKSETVELKNEIIRLARSRSIRPDWLCVDKTGAGAGTWDLLRHEYGSEVLGLNYSEGASETRIFSEDHAPASELYERMASQLWFCARRFAEFELCKISPTVNTDELFPELTQRRYHAGRRAKVEAKDSYQSRCQNRSPDNADAFMLLIHCCRVAAGWVPSMSGSSDTRPGEEDLDDDRGYTDITNRTEYL